MIFAANTHPPAAQQHLSCHPATPCALALAITVQCGWADWLGTRGLLLHYRLLGEVSGLRLPAAATPGPADDLWRRCCLEAFVACPGQTAYHEFNFSPSGQWAAYPFDAVRVRAVAQAARPPQPAPELRWQRSADELKLLAWLPGAALPESAPACGLQLGLSAVIETRCGQLSYWALRHPGERPDFHHRGGFVLHVPHNTNGAPACRKPSPAAS
ncbi:DOMON-like domain-containing protein [Hydrogenophaga sp.]|uniref:DOMON-like domain-containing protein n=1 Tax=Hydrogenophaga sp. TaxID=1904254 RepID=UPI0025BD7CD5|nr:DOMON-like domain-containing protein [Hydrogenophaga sp.]